MPPVREDQEREESASRAGMTRVVPIAIMPREDLPWLLPPQRPDGRSSLTSQAAATLSALEQGGAQFFTELRQRTRLLETELESALGELARLGLVTADGFGSIRPFVSKARSKPSPAYGGLPRRFAVKPTYSLGGRWALFPGMLPTEPDPERVLKWAWLLLRRYGVMFRELLTRESAAPSWGELARVYRTLEARGEIRGGRFVVGPSGEQFALADAVAALRKVREHGSHTPWTVISAADPLNLFGIITRGDRIAAEGSIFGGDKIPSSRSVMMVVQGADIVATREGHEIQFYKTLPPDVEGAMREALQLSGVFRTQKMQQGPFAAKKSPATHSLELG
jgi:ATP-dependent Lhr-like helicase